MMNAIDACYQMYKDLDKMITEKIKRIQCDKTFRAKITGQISADKYKIFYKNKECTVTCDGSVNVGDWVWVCAPCNNWDDLYIQLGRSMQNQINKTNSNLTALSNKFGLLNITLFRVNFNSTTNRIILEFYKSSTEIYYLGINVTTKEIILDSSINGNYVRVWTIS
jgi:hypothetical protein